VKKRTRRKMLAGHREPNGRLSRRVVYVNARDVMNAKEAQSVVVAARMRHYGISEDAAAKNVAGSPNAGTVHGRMALDGEKAGGISQAQWDAAEWFIGKRGAYLRAIESPNQETGRTEGGGEFDPDRHAEFCRMARESWSAVCDCIQTASTENRAPLMSALDVFLVRGHHLQHMVGDLRIALNAVHRRFLAGQRRTG